MKYIFLLLLFSFLSCHEGKEKGIIEIPKKIKKNEGELLIDSSLISMDSIIVKNKKFYVKHLDSNYWKDKKNPNCNLIIQNEEGDTIFKNENITNGFELKDFDQDGFVDVEIHYITNVPNIYDMILYDKKNNDFKQIVNFSEFPTPEKIKKADYYYSYHRSGCADLNWDSDLFYIKNFKCYRIGNISGRGCGPKNTTGIYINKIVADQEVLLKFVKREEGYYDDKWEFIESYWTKNYKKFAK